MYSWPAHTRAQTGSTDVGESRLMNTSIHPSITDGNIEEIRGKRTGGKGKSAGYKNMLKEDVL